MDKARIVCKEMLQQRGWVIDEDDGEGDGHGDNGDRWALIAKKWS